MADSKSLTLNSELNKLYYDSKEMDANLFLYHVDMIPGKTFEDYLDIKNLTNNSYMLYIKIKNDSITEEELDLLKNINIIIRNQNKDLLYDGPAIGSNYRVDNTMIDDIIYIGYYNPYEKDSLTIDTTLKKDYETVKDNNLANIEWEFYAMSDSKVEIINPNTYDNISKTILVLITTLILIIILIYLKKKKKI